MRDGIFALKDGRNAMKRYIGSKQNSGNGNICASQRKVEDKENPPRFASCLFGSTRS